jgi:hypothetical protein
VRFHHIGIPTNVPREGEIYLSGYGAYATDHEDNPYGVQWMRYDPDCPLPELVKTVAHVAFEVDDLQEALEGKEVLIEPNSPSKGVQVAFIIVKDAPVELLEFTD